MRQIGGATKRIFDTPKGFVTVSLSFRATQYWERGRLARLGFVTRSAGEGFWTCKLHAPARPGALIIKLL